MGIFIADADGLRGEIIVARDAEAAAELVASTADGIVKIYDLYAVHPREPGIVRRDELALHQFWAKDGRAVPTPLTGGR